MPRATGRKDLSALERLEIIAFLTVRQQPCGALPRGAQTAAALQYGCHRNTFHAVWEGRHGVRQHRQGGGCKYTEDEITEMVQAVPVHERTTLRSTAAGAGIPHTTLITYVGKDKALRRATARVKPAITVTHKQARLRFVLAYVERPIGLRCRMFDPMYNVIHVDEKWFYLHRTATSYVLTATEEKPHIPCQNKNFILKVMFLAVVARPRYDYAKNRGFDGKLGIFPIVTKRLAKRTTKNQKKGDWITEPLSVDKSVYRDLLLNSVLPAIQARWPGRKKGTIYIQQDNASPHSSAKAAVSEAGLDKYGWDVRISRQPAKSPDLNILDLGYFNAIQSLQHRKRAYNIDSLIKAVQESFLELEVKTLEKCFLTLQAVMEQVMLAEGGNNYDLPRVKRKYFPDGVFPASLPCSDIAYNTAITALKPKKQNLFGEQSQQK